MNEKMNRFLVSPRIGWLALMVALIMLGAVFAPTGWAQDAAAGAAPAATTQESKTLMELFHEGGIVMYFLAICSIAMVALALQMFMRTRTEYACPPALASRLKELVATGNYDEAVRACKAMPRFLTNVLEGGLTRLNRGREAVEFGLEESATREATAMRAQNSYLSTIAVITPMIGLLGTVIGMIKAFHTLGVGGAKDPTMLAKAISEVLIATASGLFIAVPAFIFYFIFRNRIAQVTLTVENKINDIIENIPFAQAATAAAPAHEPSFAPMPPVGIPSAMPVPQQWASEQAASAPVAMPASAPAWGGVPVVAPTAPAYAPQPAFAAPSASSVGRMPTPAVLVGCPNCNAQVPHGVPRCPACGTTLAWN